MQKVFLISLVCLLTVNCTNHNDDEADSIDCSLTACTEIFISINVTVKDASSVAVALDRFEVIDKDTQEDITIELSAEEFQLVQQSGNYPLYNDLFVAQNQNRTRTLLFKGFANNIQIATGEFVVSTDCCHVSLKSDKAEIIVN